MTKVAIGGVGGSGTRLVAEILQRRGFFTGGALNSASDNLWFSFLFLRPDWTLDFPAEPEIEMAIAVFSELMERTTGDSISTGTIEYVQHVIDIWCPEGRKGNRWAQIGKNAELGREVRNEDQLWAWKEPNTHIYLPWLLNKIPDLKYIHVIRNGLDMAFSQNQKQQHYWGEFLGLASDSQQQSLPARSLEYWISANNRAIEIFAQHSAERFLLLRYEDLVTRPESVVPTILKFIGQENSQSFVEEVAAEVSPSKVDRHRDYCGSVFTEAHISAVNLLGYQARFKEKAK